MNTRALTHYKRMALEAEAYRRAQERAARIAVDDMLSRIRQHDASGCDASPDAAPGWLFWLLACGYSAVLTFASYEFAVRVLPLLRGWLS